AAVANKPTPGLCFTATYKTISRTLRSKVHVQSPITKNDVEANAIWDTGASRSLITPKIATQLDLKPISKTLMATPSDKNIQSNVYLINVHLPNRATIVGVQALEGTPNSCDMLIGMDVISLGDFAVTNFNSKTMFSFRTPSMAEIDFTKHSHIEPIKNENRKTGRNDPCPCGSGKK
ncbi:retropepsin-like aspartic protease, partial [Treponema sp. R80B11-R83G3]